MVYILILSFLLSGTFVSMAKGASKGECCCAWESPTSCSECYAGNFAACVTQGKTSCKCTCADSKQDINEFFLSEAPRVSGPMGSRDDLQKSIDGWNEDTEDFEVEFFGGETTFKAVQLPKQR